MKNIFKIILTVAVAIMAAACGNKDNGPEVSTEIIGEWHLKEMSGTVASSLPQVYVNFKQDKNFELYQKVGEGRFRKYTGTYAVDGSVLTGKYSDGADWGSAYAVAFESEELVLTAQNGSEEVCRYEKKSLSQSDKDNSVVVTKSEEYQAPRFL